MPNRYIREDAIESEAVNSLGWQAEVFYRRLLNKVDDFGYYTANISLLRANIFPLQISKVSDTDVAKLLLECEKAGLVSSWAETENGRKYLAIHKWEQGRALKSKYPHPPDNIRERLQTFVFNGKQLRSYVPDSDSDPDSNSDNPPTPRRSKEEQEKLRATALQIGGWYKRRESTEWTPKEKRALDALWPIEADDLELMAGYYTAEIDPADDIRRTAILTLLNNWPGEVDRARKFCRTNPTAAPTTSPAPAPKVDRSKFKQWLAEKYPRATAVHPSELPVSMRVEFEKFIAGEAAA